MLLVLMDEFNLSKQAIINNQPIYNLMNPLIDITEYQQQLYSMSNPLMDIRLL
jgi:hypothetical protein